MIPKSYQLRDLTIRPATILAPMAGVTDTLFRRVIRGLGGCGLLMTEFTSSEGITRSAKKTLRYLYFQEDEHPITAQLFGASPQVMADAARMVEDLGYDAVDINLGCPAKKVVKCGGSGLLRDFPLLREIFSSVRAAVKIPLTIKVRAGWDETSIVAVDVAKMAQEEGVEAIAVHPRTRTQGYSGAADWNLIAAVKQAVRIPVAPLPPIPGFSAKWSSTPPPAGTITPPMPTALGYFLAISSKLPLPTSPMVLAK
jgi:tRNA-dihydrouridine synthase B